MEKIIFAAMILNFFSGGLNALAKNPFFMFVNFGFAYLLMLFLMKP